MPNKCFTYEEAVAVLEQVRERTLAAHERLQELRGRADHAPPGSDRAHKLGEWINTVISDWAESIGALGALPKGLWTVDFDSGQGFFYCWTLDEPTLTHYHRYEEGFMGRKPLTDDGDAPLLLN